LTWGLAVGALRDRLVEAAVLGLREPVGGEHDALLGGGDAGVRGEEQGRERAGEAMHARAFP